MKRYLVIVTLLVFIGCESEELIQPEPDLFATPDHSINKSANAGLNIFPDLIPLPNGFSPEGITSGSGTDFFVGSLADGSIYKGDYRDGSGSLFVSGTPGKLAVGMDYDERTKYLYVSGGFSESGVYDENGALITSISFTPGGFINDVIVTNDAAYFTDSFAPVIYALSLNKDGSLKNPLEIDVIGLTGDFTFIPGTFNANGIVATPGEKQLIVANGSAAELYLVDPATGNAKLINLMGDNVPTADGLVLKGNELFVVQNFLNQIAVVKLKPGYEAGTITNIITSPDFRIPTTAAEFGSSIYAVNARFDVAPPGVPNELEFEVVKVDRK